MADVQVRERQRKVSEEETQSVSLKRRRLVKGLVGVSPGIFTLYSGNAAALASATQRCILSDRANFDETSVIISDNFFTDAYQRGTLSESAIQVQGPGNVLKWIAGVPQQNGELHWYEVQISGAGGISWADGSEEWIYTGSTGGSNPKRKFEAPGVNGSWQEQDATSQPLAHSLFCVDDNGDVVSAYPAECGMYKPVNRSCWASIDPGAPDPTDRGGFW